MHRANAGPHANFGNRALAHAAMRGLTLLLLVSSCYAGTDDALTVCAQLATTAPHPAPTPAFCR